MRAKLLLLLLLISFISTSVGVDAVVSGSSSSLEQFKGYEPGSLGKTVNTVIERPENDTNLYSWNGELMESTIVGLSVIMSGENAVAYNTNDPAKMGVLGGLGTALDRTFDSVPKNVTLSYMRSLKDDNLLFGSKAYAQTGTQVLSSKGLQNFWRHMRDLSYAMLVVIMVIFGFMIMVGKKIDPRTVITAQSALPKVFIALILITFSFPITALMIDLGNVLTGVVAGIMDAVITDPATNEPFQLISANVGTIIRDFSMGGLEVDVGGRLANLIIQLLIRIFAAVIAFHVLFTLIMAFVRIFIAAIFAPLAFAWSVLPGQEDLLRTWFRQVFVAVLTFPAVYFLLNLAKYVRLNFVGITLPPGMGGGGEISGLLAVGVLLFATKVPNMLQGVADRGGPQMRGVVKALPIIRAFA